MSDYQADNDYDELIDNLPASLRNKILQHLDAKSRNIIESVGLNVKALVIEPSTDQDLNTPQRKRRRLPLWRRIVSCIFAVVWFLWAIPWILVGVAVCMTIIGIPLGVLLMKIGAWPLQKQITLHLNRGATINEE